VLQYGEKYIMNYKCHSCGLVLPESLFYGAMIKHEKYPDCIECTKALREAKKNGITSIRLRKDKKNQEVVSIKPERKKTLIEEYAYSYSIEREYGYVYIIGVAGEDFNEPVKIGYTVSSVQGRLSQLNSSHWKDLHVIYQSMEIPWAKKMERYLHKRFANERVNREWFKLDYCHFDDIQEELELPYIREELLEEFIELQETNETTTDRMIELAEQFENTFIEIDHKL
jgi:hypothetical protein